MLGCGAHVRIIAPFARAMCVRKCVREGFWNRRIYFKLIVKDLVCENCLTKFIILECKRSNVSIEVNRSVYSCYSPYNNKHDSDYESDNYDQGSCNNYVCVPNVTQFSIFICLYVHKYTKNFTLNELQHQCELEPDFVSHTCSSMLG